jgi:hypothetical protein
MLNMQPFNKNIVIEYKTTSYETSIKIISIIYTNKNDNNFYGKLHQTIKELKLLTDENTKYINNGNFSNRSHTS